MRLRRLLAWIPVAALAASGSMGCDDNGNSGKEQGSAVLALRCEQLARTCSEGDAHVKNVAAECKESAEKLAAKGCTQEATAVFTCYQEKLCSSGDKVWALNDLRVLSKRHKKCLKQRKSLRMCVKNKAASKN